jgi:mono/diheme cytochrome c family protein
MAIHPKWQLALVASMAFSVGYAGEASDLSGAELYATLCANCHGPSAHGNGPVAPLLKIPVPDLTQIAARRGGLYSPKEIHQIIDGRSVIEAHGSREMPIWGQELYAYDGKDVARRKRVNKMIAELVAYLGFIQSVRID